MTEIEFLSIRGIRSFGPKKPQVIKFFKPLTLIVGQNGCGKTTIIECLNAATTGCMPPGTQKGRHWIHDPRIEGESAIKAQVRFQFSAAVTEKKILCIRSYQLTQKTKDKQEFKQLDASIQTLDKDKNLQSTSHRCTEIDQLVPQYMNVSKAILENVTFCHQQEISWPLSESNKLRQKFDDIFASTRYSKALKSLKDVRKKYADALRNYRGDIGLYKALCEELEILINDESRESEKVVILKEESTEFQRQMDEESVIVRKYRNVHEKAERIKKRMTSKEGELKSLKRTVREMHEGLEQEIGESDEQIRVLFQNFKIEVQKLTRQRVTLKKSVQTVLVQKKDIENKTNRLATEVGILTENKNEQAKRIHNASMLINAYANRYSFDEFQGGSENEQHSAEKIISFSDELGSRLKSKKSRLSDLQTTHEEERDELQTKLSSALEAIKSNNKLVKENTRKVKQENKKARKAKMDQEGLKMDSGTVDAETRKVHVLQQQLNKLKTSYDLDGVSNEITELSKSIRGVNSEIEELQGVLKQRENENLIAMRIKDLQADKQKLEKEIDKIWSEMQDYIDQVFRMEEVDAIDVDSVSSVLKGKKKSVRRELAKARKEMDNVKKQHAKYKTECEIVRKNLDKDRKKSKDLETKISNLLDGKDWRTFDSVREDTKQEEVKIRDNIGFSKALLKCYGSFKSHGNEHNECAVCAREFKDDDEKKDFMEKQDQKLEKAPKILEKKTKKLKKTTKRLEAMDRRISDHKELCKLIDEIMPENEGKIDKLETCMEQTNAEVEKNAVVVNEKEDKVEKLDSLLEKSREIDGRKKRMKDVDKKMRQQDRELQKIQTSNVPISELQEQLDGKKDEYKTSNDRIENLRNEHSKKSKELQTKNSELSRQKDVLNKCKINLQKFENYQTKINELTKRIKEIEQENLDVRESKIPPLKREKQRLEDEKNELTNEQKKKERKLDVEIDEMSSDCSQLKGHVMGIKKYTNEEKEEQLQMKTMAHQKIQVQAQDIEKKVGELQTELDEKTKIIQKKQMIEQNVSDNLNYRKKKRELEKIEGDVKDLNDELSDLLGEEGEYDEDDLRRKNKNINKYKQQVSRREGEIDSRKKRLKDLAKRKKSDKFKSVHDNFRATMIKLQTTKAAVDDINKYYSALESALLKFHEMKIKEINNIIKELWQKTYRGSDIDTIEIRADKVGARKAGTYNYRVVMIKGNVVLDMRGRCSAGQKILACLIIRLALSESFCLDFGVLCLDEPVQNLDVQNMTAFANSLKDIIKERKEQSNFQLVVITHNEQFAQRLGSAEYVDHFYKISKDPDTGFSIITKKKFSERT